MESAESLSGKLLRSAKYYYRRPSELQDRVIGELDRRLHPQPRQNIDLLGCQKSLDPVHELLGTSDVPCQLCEGFDEALARAVILVPNANHHDSAAATARAAWTAVRHLRPQHVVETGVARGLTSAVILQALARNESGHLWSIDLPEVYLVVSGEAGAAVPEDLRGEWTVLRGASRRLLPSLLRRLTSIDLFLHDSLHTKRNMLFEFELAWSYLRPQGVLIADDIDHSTAFRDFTQRVVAPCRVQRRLTDSGALGVIVKPPVS